MVWQASCGNGIKRSDMLMIDTSSRALSAHNAFYLIGAARKLFRLDVRLDGSRVLRNASGDLDITPEVESAVIGRVRLHTREV